MMSSNNISLVVDGKENYSLFLAIHRQQLESSSVPEYFWKTLFKKLSYEIFDAGEYFSILKVVENDEISFDEISETNEDKFPSISWKVIVSCERGINCMDPKHIYLIDHAWTFRVQSARQQLSISPDLVKRMAMLLDIESNEKTEKEIIEEILEEMWKFTQTYTIGNPLLRMEDTMPIWYIMDEFGCRIQHSDDPSFETVPFYYAPAQISFTLLFPLKNLNCNDEITRSFIPGHRKKDSLFQQAYLLPWKWHDFTDVDIHQVEADTSFFLANRYNETLPDLNKNYPAIPSDRKLKVFSEYDVVNRSLSHPNFELVDNEDEADVLWYNRHFKDFRKLSEFPWKRINQFPYESVVTIKDLLAMVCRRMIPLDQQFDSITFDTNPLWLPTTYNLETELPKFVSYFQQREKRKLDNHWICKPWNLARSLDITITCNLNHIVRLPDTGPKIICKYIDDPVLFKRENIGLVKFDLRFIVILTSVQCLRLFAYKNFWLRFSNKPFSLDHLDEYEKHLTVMNYSPDTPLLQMYCHKFIEEFEKQYSEISWKNVEDSIFRMIKEAFIGATSELAPRGISHCPQSRAMYGVDVMLKWAYNDTGERYVQPMLLEINWAPDCERANIYYPSFFNDVFSFMFLDDLNVQTMIEL